MRLFPTVYLHALGAEAFVAVATASVVEKI